MMIVSICVGSSCHLKGSEKLVALFQKRIAEERLEEQIVLRGSLCLGKCNREGVTISVDRDGQEEITQGVTPEGFERFWSAQIRPGLEKG